MRDIARNNVGKKKHPQKQLFLTHFRILPIFYKRLWYKIIPQKLQEIDLIICKLMNYSLEMTFSFLADNKFVIFYKCR